MSTAAQTRRYNKLRIERGLCIQCGTPHGGRGQRCPECSKKATQAMREWEKSQREKGLCVTGNHPNDRLPMKQCSDCAERQSERLRLRRQQRKVNGHCTKCPATTVFGRGLCFDHWCASTANNALKKWDRGPELKVLWETQGGRCALTGLPLDADAQIDHIHPRSLGGDHSIDNLRWVAGWVNEMKRDATDDEFKARIRHLIAWSL